MSGRFITFEGVEGAGKSTQIALLAGWLGAAGVACLVTREPGGTRLGERVREILLEADHGVSPLAEVLLYAADRAQHLAEVVEPALSASKVVLCDRHADSLVAYQAFGRGLDRGLVDTLNRIATGGRKPDLTIYLDLEPATGLFRVADRGKQDRLERESLAFHERVRGGFLALAAEEPARFRVVRADRPPDDVQNEIRALTAGLEISSR